MHGGPAAAAARRRRLLLLLLCAAAAGTWAWGPLGDDTYRNGGQVQRPEDSALQHSSVFEALRAPTSSSTPSGDAAPVFLKIQQTVAAPTRNNPPRLPRCISPQQVSQALAAGMSERYAGQLNRRAINVDTTYTQVLNSCRYVSYITYTGPEQVRVHLVAAADSGGLCEALPEYCKAVGLVSVNADAKAAAAAAASRAATAAAASSSGSVLPSAEAASVGVASTSSIRGGRSSGSKASSSAKLAAHNGSWNQQEGPAAAPAAAPASTAEDEPVLLLDSNSSTGDAADAVASSESDASDADASSSSGSTDATIQGFGDALDWGHSSSSDAAAEGTEGAVFDLGGSSSSVDATDTAFSDDDWQLDTASWSPESSDDWGFADALDASESLWGEAGVQQDLPQQDAKRHAASIASSQPDSSSSSSKGAAIKPLPVPSQQQQPGKQQAKLAAASPGPANKQQQQQAAPNKPVPASHSQQKQQAQPQQAQKPLPSQPQQQKQQAHPQQAKKLAAPPPPQQQQPKAAGVPPPSPPPAAPKPTHQLLKAKVQDDAELPPMLGYSCKRYTHVQALDHFAAEPFPDAVAAQIAAANNAQQTQQRVATAAVRHLAKQQQQQQQRRRLLQGQPSLQQQVAVGSDDGTGAAQQQPGGSIPSAPVQQQQQPMVQAAPDQLLLQPRGSFAEPVWQLPPQVLQPGVTFAGDPLLLLPEQQPEVAMLEANSWQQQQQQPSIQQQPHAAAGQAKQAKLARTAPGRRQEQLLLRLGAKQHEYGGEAAEESDDYHGEQPLSHEEAKQPYGQQELQQQPNSQQELQQQPNGQQEQQPQPNGQQEQQQQPYQQQPQPYDPQQYGLPLLEVPPIGMPYYAPYVPQPVYYYQQPLYQELPVQLPYGQVAPQPYYYYAEPGSGYQQSEPPTEPGQPGDVPQQQQQQGRGGDEADWREEALRQQRQRSEWEARAREAEEEEELERRQQAPPPLDPVAAGELGIERDRSLPEGTFKQTYWVCDAAWPSNRDEQEASGHVLVYLGGATPLGAAQPPMIFENARRHNALVVMVEHRYFGDSLPFKVSPNAKLPTPYYRWLTMPQAMQDTVAILRHVRQQHSVPASVPAIIVGGSYGGMLATYHRLMYPEVFAAAVASSAPIKFILDTPEWRDASDAYHRTIARAADAMSGGTTCSSTIKTGLERLVETGISAQGRQQLARVFRLCGDPATALPDKDAVQALHMQVVYAFQAFAQVNNQPPLLGEMALACKLVADTVAAGKTPVQALAAVLVFFAPGDSNCLNLDLPAPEAPLLPFNSHGLSSFTYQACTCGVVFSSKLPLSDAEGTLMAEARDVTRQEVRRQCKAIFGPSTPPLRPPGFARDALPLLRRIGGVVFTNGDLDGFAAGSLMSAADVGEENEEDPYSPHHGQEPPPPPPEDYHQDYHHPPPDSYGRHHESYGGHVRHGGGDYRPPSSYEPGSAGPYTGGRYEHEYRRSYDAYDGGEGRGRRARSSSSSQNKEGASHKAVTSGSTPADVTPGSTPANSKNVGVAAVSAAPAPAKPAAAPVAKLVAAPAAKAAAAPAPKPAATPPAAKAAAAPAPKPAAAAPPAAKAAPQPAPKPTAAEAPQPAAAAAKPAAPPAAAKAQGVQPSQQAVKPPPGQPATKQAAKMEGYGSSEDSSGEEPWRGGGREGRREEPEGSSRGRLAFVVYKNASHASDLHGENLGDANQPPEWKRQRAEALATAVAFAQEFRQGMLQEAAGGEPLL